MGTKISDFLLTNDNNTVSDSILWETFKVVMKGNTISFQSSKKTARLTRLSAIESELSTLEDAYRQSNSPDTLDSILKIKIEYNKILSDQVINHIQKLKQRHFELSHKANKLLSRQLKGVQAERAIHKISSPTGELIINPKKINERFANHFAELYTSLSNSTESDIAGFLNSLQIPTLEETARQEIDADFTLEEIKAAIRSFPNGKACGPDGFGIEFYKANIEIVAPVLLRMVKCSLDNGIFPKTIYDAHL